MLQKAVLIKVSNCTSVVKQPADVSYQQFIFKTDKMTWWKSKAIKGWDEEGLRRPLVHDGKRAHKERKKFMRQHPAFDRDDLQDWLNLFWFMTKDTRDLKERVMELLERAILIHQVVKYRDVLGKKSRK